MKGRLVDESAKIYAEAAGDSISIATLKKGEVIELGKAFRKKKEVWVAVTLPTGQNGFIEGKTRIFSIKKVQTITQKTDLLLEPNAESPVIKSYPKNSILTTEDVVDEGSDSWVKVSDAEGQVGYLKGNSRIRLHEEVTKESSKKTILNGAIFVLMAGAFYFMANTQTEGSSSLLVVIVVVLGYGLVQIFKGALQYYNLRKKDEKPQD